MAWHRSSLLVDQGGMCPVDEFTIQADLAEVGGVVQEVLEDAICIDDRGRTIVTSSQVARRSDTPAVEVVSQGTHAVLPAGIKMKDLPDDWASDRVFNDGTVFFAIARREHPEQLALALELGPARGVDGLVPHAVQDSGPMNAGTRIRVVT